MHVNRFVLFLLLSFIVACGSCAGRDIPRINMHERPIVGRLEIYDSDATLRGRCTVWKAADEIMITAGHCCASDRYYTISGTGMTLGIDITLLIDDDDKDICVLRGRMDGRRALLASKEPEIGDRVWVVGYPHGTFAMTDGYWSGRNDEGDPVTSIDGAGGYSGSPVMNEDNEVIGVLVKGYLGQSVTMVAPLDKLRIDIRRGLIELAKIKKEEQE